MADFRIAKMPMHPAIAVPMRYGLALASVGAALALSIILVHYHLPRLFGAFSSIAIAISFWFGATDSGVLAVLLSCLVFLFLPPVTEIRGPAWESFLAIYAMFHALAGWFSASRRRAERLLAEARDTLEARVAERTSDLARANEELQSSEERFRALFESVQVGVVVTGPKAEVLMANPAAFELLGVAKDQLLGTTSFDSKWRAIHEDGSPWPPEECPVAVVIATGRPVQNTLIGVYRPVLHDLVWLLVNAQSQFAPDGQVSRVVCAFEDITERKKAEDELRRQKEILQKIFDNVPMMISFFGADGRIELVNREWERAIGWTVEEIRQQKIKIFPETYPDVQDRQNALEFVSPAESKFTDFRTTLRDGRVIDTSWARVRLSDGTSIGIGRDITERKRVQEELQRSRDRLRALAARVETVREEERTRVAREIHDELGSSLTAIKIDLSSLVYDLPPERKEEYNSILKAVDATIQTVRRISTELRPAILDALGLVPAIEWAAEEFETRTGTKCLLDLPEDDLFIDPEHATALFRVFQETLTNVARHAGATEVTVRLTQEEHTLTLEVHDNGKGIDENQLSVGSSLGILGMRERALLLGGELRIRGEAGSGTTVTVRIPERRTTPLEARN